MIECAKCEEIEKSLKFLENENKQLREQLQEEKYLLSLNRQVLNAIANRCTKSQDHAQHQLSKTIQGIGIPSTTRTLIPHINTQHIGGQTFPSSLASSLQLGKNGTIYHSKRVEEWNSGGGGTGGDDENDKEREQRMFKMIFNYLQKENAHQEEMLSKITLERDKYQIKAFISEQIADGVQRQENMFMNEMADKFKEMNQQIAEQQKQIKKLQVQLSKNCSPETIIRYKEVIVARNSELKLNNKIEHYLQLIFELEEKKKSLQDERNELIVLNGILAKEIERLRELKVDFRTATHHQFDPNGSCYFGSGATDQKTPLCQISLNNTTMSPLNIFQQQTKSKTQSNNERAIETLKKVMDMSSEESYDEMITKNFLSDRVKLNQGECKGRELVPQLDLTKAKKIQEINLKKQLEYLKHKDQIQAQNQLQIEKKQKKKGLEGKLMEVNDIESMVNQQNHLQNQGNLEKLKMKKVKKNIQNEIEVSKDTFENPLKNESGYIDKNESMFFEKCKEIEASLIKTKAFLEDEMVKARVLAKQLDEITRYSREQEAINHTLLQSNCELQAKQQMTWQLLSNLMKLNKEDHQRFQFSESQEQNTQTNRENFSYRQDNWFQSNFQQKKNESNNNNASYKQIAMQLAINVFENQNIQYLPPHLLLSRHLNSQKILKKSNSCDNYQPHKYSMPISYLIQHQQYPLNFQKDCGVEVNNFFDIHNSLHNESQQLKQQYQQQQQQLTQSQQLQSQYLDLHQKKQLSKQYQIEGENNDNLQDFHYDLPQNNIAEQTSNVGDTKEIQLKDGESSCIVPVSGINLINRNSEILQIRHGGYFFCEDVEVEGDILSSEGLYQQEVEDFSIRQERKNLKKGQRQLPSSQQKEFQQQQQQQQQIVQSKKQGQLHVSTEMLIVFD